MKENDVKKKYNPGYIIIGILVLPFPLLMIQLLVYAMSLLVISVLLGLIVLAISGIVLCIGGIAMFGVGVSRLFSMPMGAISIAGYGLANIGVAFLTECFVLWIFMELLPKAFRKVCKGKEDVNEEAA